MGGVIGYFFSFFGWGLVTSGHRIGVRWLVAFTVTQWEKLLMPDENKTSVVKTFMRLGY